MPRSQALIAGLVCLLVSAGGCTHVQLRKNAVREAGTISYFHRQQVLDNLALFAYDYNALPFFSFPNQTSAIVTDQGSAGFSPTFSRPTAGPVGIIGQFLFSSFGMSFTAQRAAQEGFTVTPVNDPRKLELMRCAYQRVMSYCGRGQEPTTCPDCKTRFNQFYTGDLDGDIRLKTQGMVTTECLDNCCWLKVGCKKCMPKHCPCEYIGHYCDTYIWVLPEGRDELTKLTLMILDFALHDPPTRLSKQVIYYVDELGLPTDRSRAVGQVTATVAINERNESVLSVAPADEVRLLQMLEGRLTTIGQQLEQNPQNSALMQEKLTLEHKIAYLNEQIRVGSLKQQFSPSGGGPIAPFSVIPLLQQQIQTLSQPITPLNQ